MASSLNQLFRKLSWNDFPKATKTAPAPNTTAIAAHTDTKAAIKYNYKSGSGGVQLQDDLTVTIVFKREKSWVAKWVFKQPPKFQTDLLNHEQGHYNITALMGRDMFIELMQLKSQSFSTLQGLEDKIKAIATKFQPQPVHDKYDEENETNHGMKHQNQTKWDGYLRRAFTVARNPVVTAPDGKQYKVRLLDVLKAAGKTP